MSLSFAQNENLIPVITKEFTMNSHQFLPEKDNPASHNNDPDDYDYIWIIKT